uniref:Uncharacterized protein n=1 Tax=Anguilla anguilla TaxID=7936 RepID=A0A0E9SKR7_ANGAN
MTSRHLTSDTLSHLPTICPRGAHIYVFCKDWEACSLTH